MRTFERNFNLKEGWNQNIMRGHCFLYNQKNINKFSPKTKVLLVHYRMYACSFFGIQRQQESSKEFPFYSAGSTAGKLFPLARLLHRLLGTAGENQSDVLSFITIKSENTSNEIGPKGSLLTHVPAGLHIYICMSQKILYWTWKSYGRFMTRRWGWRTRISRCCTASASFRATRRSCQPVASTPSHVQAPRHQDECRKIVTKVPDDSHPSAFCTTSSSDTTAAGWLLRLLLGMLCR